MEPTISAALIALLGTSCIAGATFIGTLLTLFLGLRGLKVEREKLAAETAKMRIEFDEARQQRLAIESANIEIEKQKSINLLESQNSIYAEMLELVYRLKNQFRHIVQTQGDNLDADSVFFVPDELGQELYLLTENLYKYRAYIDEETFEMLHQYKRTLQDVQVLFNRITRPPEIETMDWKERREAHEKSALEAYQESKIQIEATYQEIEKSYNEITHRIKSHIESVITRKD